MIVVNNDNNLVIGYSHIKIEVNNQGHIICWDDNDETWYGLAGYENYTIYDNPILYPPSLDAMWFYINGEFIEYIPEEPKSPSGMMPEEPLP